MRRAVFRMSLNGAPYAPRPYLALHGSMWMTWYSVLMMDDDAPAGGHDIPVPIHILAIGELGDESLGHLDKHDRCFVSASGFASDVPDQRERAVTGSASRLVSRLSVFFSNQKKRLRIMARVN